MRVKIGKRIYDTETAKEIRRFNTKFFNSVVIYQKKCGEYFCYKQNKDYEVISAFNIKNGPSVVYKNKIQVA